jgi:hypothetical protein
MENIRFARQKSLVEKQLVLLLILFLTEKIDVMQADLSAVLAFYKWPWGRG